MDQSLTEVHPTSGHFGYISLIEIGFLLLATKGILTDSVHKGILPIPGTRKAQVFLGAKE